MCEDCAPRGKKHKKSSKPIGVVGLVTAAGFGIWLVHAMPDKTTVAAPVKAAVPAAQTAAAGSGFPTGAVIVAAIVALAVGLAAWLVVGKIRDMLEDRHAAEVNRLDQVEQIKARAQQQQLAPRRWRYTLTGTTSNGATGSVSDEIEFPSASRIEVKREVLRRAYAKDPQAKLTARVELVSR